MNRIGRRTLIAMGVMLTAVIVWQVLGSLEARKRDAIERTAPAGLGAGAARRPVPIDSP